MDGGDKGGEFSQIRAYADLHGNRILPTGRSNPNGNALVAEVSIQVVSQKMCASLHSSNLSDSYWSEALLHSVETTNRLPTTGLPNHNSPYESWYGRSSTLPTPLTNVWIFVFRLRSCRAQTRETVSQGSSPQIPFLWFQYRDLSPLVTKKQHSVDQVCSFR